MEKQRKAALRYAMSLAKIDKETGAPEEETRRTTPIAIGAFLAGVEWQKEEPSRMLKLERYSSSKSHKYCDTCEHFRPEEGERKPIDELCEFIRPLRFKAPSDYDFICRNNWGFYLPGCKDYKQVE